MSEKRNVPSLRFREFQENWVERKLDEAFKNSRKKGKKGFPIYSVSQAKGLVPRDSLDRVIQNDAKPEQNLLVEPGELTYNMMRMWQGAYGVSSTTCMVSPAYVVLTPKKQHLSQFYSFLFERARSRYLFTTYSHGLTLDRLRLYPGDFLSIPILFPSLPEQQKIAEFLKAVDKRIELLQAKKEKLEAYKKGVMQQIFSQKLRFKMDDGSDFPDWEERKLGEIVQFSKGKGLPKSDITDTGPLKCIHYGELFTKYKEHIIHIKSRTSEGQNMTLSEKNDVLMPTSDVTPNGLATASCIKETGVVLGGDILILRQKVMVLDGIFLAYFISQNRKEVMRRVAGSTVYHLYGSDMKTIMVQVPSLEEQKKIVQFLTSLDSSIETLEKQIHQTQTWKKGLLQKMFV